MVKNNTFSTQQTTRIRCQRIIGTRQCVCMHYAMTVRCACEHACRVMHAHSNTAKQLNTCTKLVLNILSVLS